MLEHDKLPGDPEQARKLALQEYLFVLADHILYHLDPRYQNCKQAVVLEQFWSRVMEESHRGPIYGGPLFRPLPDTGGGTECTVTSVAM